MTLFIRLFFHVYLTRTLIQAKNSRADLGSFWVLPRSTKTILWVLVFIVCVSIYRVLLNGPTTDISYCSKFLKWFFCFLLTSSCDCRSEKCNNRATGKGKQRYYFHRKMKYLFQIITVIIKFGFERYILRKNKVKVR